ncbi:MAG: hypothetical protein LUO90_04665, partial [Methanoregula sp.]|nr:hypothetical protein [Methanoregula sp.]
NGPGYKTSLPRNVDNQISQLPLHPSMQRVQIPEHGATSRERFTVPVASFAFGRLRFMNKLHWNNWMTFDLNEDVV